MSAVMEAREPSAKYLSALQPRLVQHFELLGTAPGGVAKLRELIFTLAVQGKLVPQDPTDEPASELLRKIRTEKSLSIGGGKNKRSDSPAAVLEEDFPYALPMAWEWIRNQVLFSLRKGKNPKVLSETPIGRPYLDIEALDRHQVRRYSEDATALTCSADDILVVCDGSRSGLILQGKDGIVGSTLAVIECPKLVQPYLRLIFRAGFQRYNSGMKGAAIPHLDTKTVLTEVIGLPPLAEQFRIVTRVEELMRLCDALEAKDQLEAAQHTQLVQTLLGALTASTSSEELVDNWQRVAIHFDLLVDRPEAIDALEQTILQLAVRGLLVPQDPKDEPASELLKKIRTEKDRLIAAGKVKQDKPLANNIEVEAPFALPLGWERVTIDTLASVGSGTTPSRDNSNFFSGGSIPWVTSGETGKSFISETAQYVTEAALSQTSLTVYPVGTLIVAMYGQGKTRGQVSELQIEATTNQACAAIVLVEPSPTHRSFVKLVFEKSYEEMRELSAGGAQPNLNVGKIKSTLIPLPPMAEQARIVARVESLRRLCADLRQRLAARQTTQAHLAEALIDEVA